MSRSMGVLEQQRVVSVKVDVAEGPAAPRSFFGFTEGFGKFFIEEVVLIFFRIDGLAEDAFLAFILFAHGAGGGFEIFEGTFARRWCVGDDGTQGGIDFEDAAAVRACNFKQLAAGFAVTHVVYCRGSGRALPIGWPGRFSGRTCRGEEQADLNALQRANRRYFAGDSYGFSGSIFEGTATVTSLETAHPINSIGTEYAPPTPTATC